jgi:glycosyltransferase involved in cell wall biosynthesis
MRILCFIDNLGGGGAQRQLCRLAVLLHDAGHEVSMLTYHEGGMFAEMLDRASVPRLVASGRGGIERLRSVRRAIRSAAPDVVLAFLPMPCLYAELAGLPRRRWGLVVGERSTTPDETTLRLRALRNLHRLADAVVTNSHANRLLIERTVPRLRDRVSTIYNLVDLKAFAPSPLPPLDDGPLKVVVAASYQTIKNVRGWIEAMRLLAEQRNVRAVVTDWYGGGASRGRGHDEREIAEGLIQTYGLADRVRLHDSSAAIGEQYKQAHVVALPSLLEGLPNVVCEGMACARPVATSEVSDARNLVHHRHTGVLFDPSNAVAMADEMSWLASRSAPELRDMGQAGRARAESLFAPDRVLAAYSMLLETAASRRRGAPVFWPTPAAGSHGNGGYH